MLNQQQIQAARERLGIAQGSAPVVNRASELESAWGQSTAPSEVAKPDPLASVHIGGTNVKNPIDAIKEQFRAGTGMMKEAGKEISAGGTPIQGFESGLKGEAGLATAITAPLAPIFRPLSQIIGDIGNKIGDIPAVQKFAESKAGKTTARVAEDLSNAGTVAGTILGADQIVKNAPSVIEKAKSISADVRDSFAAGEVPTSEPKSPNAVPSFDPQTQQKIVNLYTKAIKPTVVGKKTPNAYETYNSNVVNAIKSIVDNQTKLSFTTPDGEVQVGRTPQSVSEFTQAIDQTQAGIFDRYNALAQQTGEAGIKISAKPVVEELDRVINNEAIQISHPEAIKEAEAIRSRIMDMNKDNSFGIAKEFDPSTVQEIIKGWNSALEAFYRNPSYDSASRAAVAAGTVKAFRMALADAIEKTTGENYSALKQEYGALSAIEADVAKRAIVLSRQASATGGGGIADYAQIFSGGDMVHGLLSLNPALFAKGAAQSALTKLFTYLKSPDRAIKNMFTTAENLSTSK